MPRISPPVRHEVRAIRSVLLNKGKSIMERVTLRIPEQQIDEVEQMVERGSSRIAAKRFGPPSER